jgi:hypothetical protein
VNEQWNKEETYKRERGKKLRRRNKVVDVEVSND